MLSYAILLTTVFVPFSEDFVRFLTTSYIIYYLENSGIKLLIPLVSFVLAFQGHCFHTSLCHYSLATIIPIKTFWLDFRTLLNIVSLCNFDGRVLSCWEKHNIYIVFSSCIRVCFIWCFREYLILHESHTHHFKSHSFLFSFIYTVNCNLIYQSFHELQHLNDKCMHDFGKI